MNTELIFNYLEAFKNFPTYQFERRIDAFLLPYLTKAINQRFNLNDPDLILVYPEFPLMRLNNTEEKNLRLSDSADYLLWSKKLNTVYLVELKTDKNSIHEPQFKTYLFNCEQGWEKLIDYYFIKAIGKSWKKFVSGLIYLEEKAPELISDSVKMDFSNFKNKSRGVTEYLKELRSLIQFINKPKIQFLYIAPKDARKKLNDYNKKNKESENFYIGLITLEEFSKFTEEPLNTLLESIDN
jgi:hypothetical protein